MRQRKTDGRLDRALKLLEQLEPEAPDRVMANLNGFSPDYAEAILGFAFADVLSRPGLDLKTREMLTVAMLGAMATAPGQLEFHIRAALNAGVSNEEIVEVVLQVAIYAGVPASINAVAAAKRAFAAVDGT